VLGAGRPPARGQASKADSGQLSALQRRAGHDMGWRLTSATAVGAWALASVLVCAAAPARAAPDAAAAPNPAKTAPQPAEDLVGETQRFSNEANLAPAPAQAVRLIQVAPGLKIELWASEPLLANPVAFTFDERGRAFVVETYRHTDGALDNRSRLQWLSDGWKASATPEQQAGIGDELLDAEIAARTVADRAAMVRRYMDPAFMTASSDRLTLVEDRDRDGRADHTQVFASGFGGAVDGLAAGVLARGGDVFFTNIPNLWRLRDDDGDGKAERRQVLSTGYGVRYAFIGHDLHGLRIGPDGRLYFSIGDRGAHVERPGAPPIAAPESGSVFRCELDGSRLELFASGLRNPQELVFDAQGNLFSGDNNSDGGDRARWVHLVEGGDTGWRIGFQYLEEPRTRGPWNAEKMWHERWEGQPAHLLPPVKLIGNGPAGVAYYPGSGLGKRWDGHFFLVDFRGGQASLSGVHTFKLAPEGASFTMGEVRPFVWGVLTTDFDFGPDGPAYLTDWVQGWPKPGKGRIWRVFDPALAREPDSASTRMLLAEGMAGRSPGALVALLGHADLRVRQEAQLQLAARSALAQLEQAARRTDLVLVARLHALWGLGQLARATAAWPPALPPAAVGSAAAARPRAPSAAGSAAAQTADRAAQALAALLDDPEAVIRAQAAVALGDGRVARAGEALTARLADGDARVRLAAAIAIGKLGRAEAVPAVLDLLRANADRDPYLRHGGVMALLGAADAAALARAAQDPSPSVRLAALLAWRRLGRAEAAGLLADGEPRIVREAARAINDERIEPAMAALAALPLDRQPDPAVAWRVVNAAFRQGTDEAATRLASLAVRRDVDGDARREAIAALGDWARPGPRDRVTGLWRPLAAPSSATTATTATIAGPAAAPPRPGPRDLRRDPAPAVAALQPRLPVLLARATPAPLRLAAINAVEKLGLTGAAPRLQPLLSDRRNPPELRLRVLQALAALQAPRLAAIARRAAADPDERVRLGALRVALALDPKSAPARLRAVMARGTVREKQTAAELAGGLDRAAGEPLLTAWMDRLLRGALPADVHLDLLEAARRNGSPALAEKAAAFEGRQPEDELAPYRVTLAGGSADRGRGIFFNRADASCLRCHKVSGAGADIGPDLTKVARERTRVSLLESIVFPSKEFPPGFESVILTMKDGSIQGGTVKKETAEVIDLMTIDGPATVKKGDVKTRERGGSGMPDGFGQILNKRDLRDLVAFLATLR
jgi:quinoprotein glucose dehydrogenase